MTAGFAYPGILQDQPSGSKRWCRVEGVDVVEQRQSFAEDLSPLGLLEARVAKLEADNARLRKFLVILAEAIRNEDYEKSR